MSDNAEVTILLPSFNTAELTKLCLRSLRKHTDCGRIKVLVVDNGSRDNSVEYLRSLDWIDFCERAPVPGESGASQHSSSLDMLMERVTTPYVLSIHTDTIVRSDDWLDFLLSKIKDDPQVAGVGSWKLSNWSPFKRAVKRIEDFIRFNIIFPLTGRKYDKEANFQYLRSHCALYRTELVKSLTNGFRDGMVAGKSIHKKLIEAGYRMIFIEEHELIKYLNHFDHATMILNPDMFKGRRSRKPKERKRLGEALKVPEFDAILADDSLDR